MLSTVAFHLHPPVAKTQQSGAWGPEILCLVRTSTTGSTAGQHPTWAWPLDQALQLCAPCIVTCGWLTITLQPQTTADGTATAPRVGGGSLAQQCGHFAWLPSICSLSRLQSQKAVALRFWGLYSWSAVWCRSACALLWQTRPSGGSQLHAAGVAQRQSPSPRQLVMSVRTTGN